MYGEFIDMLLYFLDHYSLEEYRENTKDLKTYVILRS